MINIFKTDSYYNVFDILKDELNKLPSDVTSRNLVFAEEKISLMTERVICQGGKGSFNTQVCSFKKYLLGKKSFDNLLSKEASTMVIKSILRNLNEFEGRKLVCFNKSKSTLSASIYELIILLKSASVSPSDVLRCLEQNGKSLNGMLKNKLNDIYIVYSAYEKYLSEHGLTDQSGQLSFLPAILREDETLPETNVFIIGYNGFTAQIRDIISIFIQSAKSVTAILPYSDTNRTFVNETVSAVLSLSEGQKVNEYFVPSVMENTEANVVKEYLFSPYLPKGVSKDSKLNTEKIFVYQASSVGDEFEKIASVIKQRVIKEKLRYKQFAVVLPDESKKDALIKAFNTLSLPFYLDDKYTVENHPLISLINSYIEIYRKNFKAVDVISFVKNPLFNLSDTLTDEFENYLLKHDINYSKIKKPFSGDEKNLLELEKVRKSFIDLTDGGFDPLGLLGKMNAEKTLEELSQKLSEKGFSKEASVSEQVYSHVVKLLSDVDNIFGNKKPSLTEYKSILASGVSALQISIIPQYNDAVFVGDFREVGLAKTDYVFVSSLTAGVPSFKEDVAILTDNDIDNLSPLKVNIDPKINIVNKRLKEQVLMGFSSFKKELYLSYTKNTESGKSNQKSDLLNKISSIFHTQDFPKTSRYLTERQGLKSFSADCGNYRLNKTDDTVDASSFNVVCDSETKKKILDNANCELVKRLKGNKSLLDKKTTSPTTVEEYFSCPYKAFLNKVVCLNENERGNIDSRKFGVIVHDLMKAFMADIDNVTEENFEEKFGLLVKKVNDDERYKDFCDGGKNQTDFENLMRETKKYCLKNLKWKLSGEYKTDAKDLEATIDFKGRFTPIEFLNGEIAVTGQVDRIDTFDKYYRVIDFKTGGYKGSVGDLFYGKSLQLYLYALAVKEGNAEKEKYKELSGVYYLPIYDGYESVDDKSELLADGATLKEDEVLFANDKNIKDGKSSEFIKVDPTDSRKSKYVTKEQLDGLLKYSYSVTESALKEMQSGFILASPTEGSCDYCKYKGICNLQEENVRKCEKIDISDILKANEGKK